MIVFFKEQAKHQSPNVYTQNEQIKKMPAALSVGEIYRRFEDDERRGEFVMFRRIIKTGTFQVWASVSSPDL